MGFHCIYSLIQAFRWKSAGAKLVRKKKIHKERLEREKGREYLSRYPYRAFSALN